ncbi:MULTISPECIES: tripartite tricarboxylate transporter permease [unclassified Rhizobacter]|uniref:tripartite tricarboxylate transporter permease n=1 Tax=unclassified Rhizobacter TaxID=2640088 RepID=UPI0006F5E52F|nr:MULTISPECIES: tripartite tricarboxylate transporter permease [unclassified Rhizobacter]KQU77960.1 tricarboxylate transporter [Rhizobacter sp. Root29]KQW15707.1 tricarboxylate transporter [Rhizobacter sp. Root1238]KRB24817.1 tricarboxylate transporter [Rhizobacter sp. Root16D2]
MEEITNLMHGFGVALTLPNLGFMLIGLTLGVLIGVLPGLGGANGVAILLPLTFSMNPTSAIIMLSCIYWGALFGGAITSILFNIPGEPWSVATTFDGYPMAQQGKAAQALTAAFTSSFVGALFAVLLITFLAPLLAKFALKFGPPEFFAVQLLTFCSFVGTSKEPPAKTIASMMLGFALAAVGMDSVTGNLRMTFGVPELLKGFDFLIAVIGLFGIGEILLTMEEGLAFKGKSAKINFKVVWQTWGELARHWKTFLRSTAIGCWMGITPGGATPASFMSYGMARRMSDDPQGFGKGQIQGVIAPETAAHAAGTSALLPMLTLGIPGSPTAAVLLGGLLIWGLQPGPMLFVEQKDFVWGLIASMYLGNLVGLIVVLTTVPWWAAILRIPFSVIAPVIIVICAIGAYTVHSAMFDVVMMLVFGVVGYVFKKLRYPLAPMVLALVLGDMAEASFRQSMLASQGKLSIFWSNPLVGGITALALVILLWPAVQRALGWARTRGSAPVGDHP